MKARDYVINGILGTVGIICALLFMVIATCDSDMEWLLIFYVITVLASIYLFILRKES